MAQTLDMRGQKCPQPVIETKKALEAMGEGILEVIVDNEAARDNIVRFVSFKGCEAEARSEKAGEYTVTVTKGQAAEEPAGTAEPETEPEIVCPTSTETVLLVTSAQIGEDNSALGSELMDSFIDVLTQATKLPDKILFMNSGVTLAVEGSPVLDALHELEQEGVTIFSCGRCLEYLHLKDKLKVGQVTNMFETVETLTSGASVVTL